MESCGIVWNRVESWGIMWNHVESCGIMRNREGLVGFFGGFNFFLGLAARSRQSVGLILQCK